MLGARWDDVCISSTLAEATYRVDPKRQSMRIPHKHDHISVILYLSKHNYISFRIVNHLLGSGFQYVFFSRNLGEDEPILTSIFFRWVVQPPNHQPGGSSPIELGCSGQRHIWGGGSRFTLVVACGATTSTGGQVGWTLETFGCKKWDVVGHEVFGT